MDVLSTPSGFLLSTEKDESDPGQKKESTQISGPESIVKKTMFSDQFLGGRRINRPSRSE